MSGLEMCSPPQANQDNLNKNTNFPFLSDYALSFSQSNKSSPFYDWSKEQAAGLNSNESLNARYDSAKLAGIGDQKNSSSSGNDRRRGRNRATTEDIQLNLNQSRNALKGEANEMAEEVSQFRPLAIFILQRLGKNVDQNAVTAYVEKSKKEMQPPFESLSVESQAQVQGVLMRKGALMNLMEKGGNDIIDCLRAFDAQNGTEFFKKLSPKLFKLRARKTAIEFLKKDMELSKKYGLDVDGALSDMGYTDGDKDGNYEKRVKNFKGVVHPDDISDNKVRITFGVDGLDYPLATTSPLALESENMESRKKYLEEKIKVFDQTIAHVSSGFDMSKEFERDPVLRMQQELEEEKSRYVASLESLEGEEAQYMDSTDKNVDGLSSHEQRAQNTLTFMKNIFLGSLGGSSMINDFIRLVNENNDQSLKIDLANGLDRQEKAVLLEGFKKLLLARGAGLNIQGKQLTEENINHIFANMDRFIVNDTVEVGNSEIAIDGFVANEEFFRQVLAQEVNGASQPLDRRTLESGIKEGLVKKRTDNALEVAFP